MTNEPRIKPTETELRILKVLWGQRDSAALSVRDVLGQLDSNVGYTTVLKLLQIMLSKGLVIRDETQRSHRYSAAVHRADIEGGLLGDLLHRLFDGSSTQLVQSALEHKHIDSTELAEIEALIRAARKRAQEATAESKENTQ